MSDAIAPGLSVVIPALDEEHAIGAVIEAVSAALRASDLAHEIIVVDDGSTDATAQVAAAHSGVVVVRHDINRGYGNSLKTGILRARHELVGIIDADGTYPAEALPTMAQMAVERDLDMVIAARVGDNVAVPALRRPAKWMLTRLANFIVAASIPDINSGCRVFRRSAALDFFALLPGRFSFTTTITLAMLSNDYAVESVPIDYFARTGRSKIRPIRDTLSFVQLILRIGLYFAPLKIFVPFAAAVFGIAVAWGLFSKFVLGQLARVTTLVIVMTAVQIGAVGLLAELINKRLPNVHRKPD